MRKSRKSPPAWLAWLQKKANQFQPSRYPAFTNRMAPYLRECPRCGGVGCKECRESRLILEANDYEPDDQINAHDGDGMVEHDSEDVWDGDELPESRFKDDEDIVDDDEPRPRRRETEDESFARKLAMGVSMLAGADDSILDD